MAASSSALATAVIVNLIILIVCLAVFSVLRILFKRDYAPKRYLESQKVKPKDLGWGLFSWVLPVLTYKEDDLVPSTGLDAAVYLRLLSFGWDLFFWLSVICIAVVLPINMRGIEVDRLLAQQNQPRAPPPPPPAPPAPPSNSTADDSAPPVRIISYEFTSFDKTSLANIPPGSDLMWVHIVWVYLVTAITLRLLWTYSKDIVGLRVAYETCAASTDVAAATAAHTVLITDIPCVGGGSMLFRVASKLKTAMSEGAASRKGGAAASGSSGREEASAAEPAGVVLDICGGGTGAGEEASRAQHSSPSSSSSSCQAGAGSRPVAWLRALRTKSAAAADPELDPRTDAKRRIKSGVSPEELVRGEVERVYGPDAVECVHVALQTAEIDAVTAEFEKLRTQLADYAEALEVRRAKGKELKAARKLVWGPLYGDWGKARYGWKPTSVDFVEFAEARLAELAEQIVKERRQVKALPAAFVTFRELTHSVTASAALHHHDETAWRVQAAPRPSDLIRSNLSMGTWSRLLRGLLAVVAFWVSVAFFMIPIAAIQGLIELPKLERVAWLRPIVTNNALKPLLEAIIPGLALKIFLALVPTLLRMLSIATGTVSVGSVDAFITGRYFTFQVITVFFGSIVAGSFFNQVQQLIDDPASIITILGTAIPMTSTFFFSFIMVSATIGPGISFTRLPDLIIKQLLGALAACPRAKERLWRQQAPWAALYGPVISQHTIVMLLGVVFSVINPTILPVCLLYFIVLSLMERYNRLYILRPQYESGGLLWRTIFGQVLVGLYIMHLTLIGILGLKKFPYATLLLPAPLLTAAFQVILAQLYNRPWSQVSMHDAGTIKSVLPSSDVEAAVGAKATDAGSAAAVAAAAATPFAAAQLAADLGSAKAQGLCVGEGADAVAEMAPACGQGSLYAECKPMRVQEVYQEPSMRLDVEAELAAAARDAAAARTTLAKAALPPSSAAADDAGSGSKAGGEGVVSSAAATASRAD